MADLSKIIGNYEELIDLALENLRQAGIDITNRQIDHIAYRARKQDEFLDIRAKLLVACGRPLAENIIRNRPVPVFKLKEPIKYRGYTIPCVELMAPAEGDREYKRKLEHLEIVVSETSLEEFASHYPGVKFITSNMNNKDNPELIITFPNDANVKFHPKAIEEVLTVDKS